MTADQEQTERGASTVSNRVYWISQASLDDIAEREVQLRTDLERVTAERDAMREALLKIEEIASRPSIADEERMSMVWQIVVLSLDATRKATTDATEEGK